jgi:F0F1-type ATP synthase assembly protein I
MPEDPPDLKDISYYYALAQVGLEMVAPLLIGLAIDHYFGSMPWATVVSTVIGFVGGFIHLIMMLNQHEARNRSKTGGGGP